MLDDAHREPQRVVDRAHPLGVALGEVVVDGDDVHATPGEAVEVRGQGGHQRLALAGGHLGDLALVQDYAAQQLDVEGHHLPGKLHAHHRPAFTRMAAAGLLDRGEGLGQQVVQDLLVFPPLLAFLGDPSLELGCFTLKIGLREVFIFLKIPVDLIDPGLEFFGIPFILAAEQLCQYLPEHNIL